MKPLQFFVAGCGLLLLAFALYVLAPSARSKFTPENKSAEQQNRPVSAASPIRETQQPESVPVAPKKEKPQPVKLIQTEATQPAPAQAAPVQPATAQPPPQQTAAAVSEPAPPPPPRVKTKIRSFQLKPGQRLTINNSFYTDLEVHSSLRPISVSIGDCASPLTFKIECHGETADVIVKDLGGAIDVGPNLVVVTGSKEY